MTPIKRCVAVLRSVHSSDRGSRCDRPASYTNHCGEPVCGYHEPDALIARIARIRVFAVTPTAETDADATDEVRKRYTCSVCFESPERYRATYGHLCLSCAQQLQDAGTWDDDVYADLDAVDSRTTK